MGIKKIIYIILGFISLALGAVGAVLPILPSVPFLLLAFVCFTKSSERLRNWFMSTDLYRNNLKDYMESREMTKSAKLHTLGVITILMAIGFIIMLSKNLYIPCGILAFIWILHVMYFQFKIRTKE